MARRGKTVLGLVAATLVVGAAACGLVKFDLERPIPEQRVEGSPLGGLLPLGVFEFPLNIDLQQETQAMKTGPASAAYLKVVSLKVLSPPTETFAFLDSLAITIAAEGLPEVEVAKLAPVPAQSQISLNTVGRVNLLPYLQKRSTMKATAKGRAPTQDITFDGRVVVTIEI